MLKSRNVMLNKKKSRRKETPRFKVNGATSGKANLPFSVLALFSRASDHKRAPLGINCFL